MSMEGTTVLQQPVKISLKTLKDHLLAQLTWKTAIKPLCSSVTAAEVEHRALFNAQLHGCAQYHKV